MPTQEEILKQQAKDIAEKILIDRQALSNTLQNNESKTKLDALVQLDQKLKAAIDPNSMSPSITNDVKNAYIFAMRVKYFEKVVEPGKQAQEEANKQQSLLAYVLERNLKNPRPEIDAEQQMLDEKNVDGEDLENDLSDEQIEQLIENDPDLPDDLGSNKAMDKLLKEEENINKSFAEPDETMREMKIKILTVGMEIMSVEPENKAENKRRSPFSPPSPRDIPRPER
jgi:hypothetical protein